MTHLLALVGAIPALLAMLYFDRLDKKRPEPRWTLRKVSIAGGLSVIPVIVVELLLEKLGPHDGYLGGLYTAFVVAAIPEELAKLLCVLALAWRRPEFDERMDGITYGARAGLGFALVENVGYLLGAKSIGALVGIFVLRALLSVPGHAIYGGIMGYYAARQRFDKAGPGILGGYAIAVALHGAYDGALFCMQAAGKGRAVALVLLLLPVPLAVVLAGGVTLRQMVRRAIADDDRTLASGRSLPMPAAAPP